MQVALNPVSSNVKTGPMPVSTSSKESCPKECPLLGTDCYARFGPLGIHWSHVTSGNRGYTWSDFLDTVRELKKGVLWRHNQAGDLPKHIISKRIINDRMADILCREQCMQLSEASSHTKGFTYTHYDPLDQHNADVIRDMNAVPGMTVNLSADSTDEADQYADLGIAPVVVVIPEDSPNTGNRTPAGRVITVCPAQTQTNVTCNDCGLCQVVSRKAIVGFKAHGTARKRLSRKLAGVE